MNRIAITALLALTAITPVHASAAMPKARTLTSAERMGLSAHLRPEFAVQRAGATPMAARSLAAAERGTLKKAVVQSSHLRALRAGELSEKEVGYIAIGALIVIALILIL